jgi:hypothetical protein
VAAIFAASRLGMLVVVLLGAQLLGSGDRAQPGNLQYVQDLPRALQAWVHFDAQWYLLIAERGYQALVLSPELAPRNRPEDTSGFFPLFPLAVRAVAMVLPGRAATALAGLLVANAALLGFLLLLHRHTGDLLGAGAARAAVIAACVAPTSVFLSAPYSESLFLLAALGAVVAAQGGRSGFAFLLAAAAALTRPVGVLIAIPLAWEAWRRRRESKGRLARFAAVLGAPAGLASYAGFCASRFGDPLAFAARQTRWRGAIGPPWTFLVEFLTSPTAHGPRGSALDLGIALAALALVPVVFRRLGPGLAAFSAAAVLLPLSSGLFAFARLSLAAFPLFAAVGVLAEERPSLRLPFLVVGSMLGGFLSALYAAGWWVG